MNLKLRSYKIKLHNSVRHGAVRIFRIAEDSTDPTPMENIEKNEERKLATPFLAQ